MPGWQLLPFLSYEKYPHPPRLGLISLGEEWRKNLDNSFIVGAVLTDLTKAFKCIPHDLLLAQLSAGNFSDKSLSYIYLFIFLFEWMFSQKKRKVA